MEVVQKTNYADAVTSLESAMKRVRYIPKYQRNYDWTKTQCESLFNDLIRFSSNPKKDSNSKYVFGQIICYNSDEDKLFILDGQQRLTTSTIFVAALRNVLIKISKQVDDEDLYESFVGMKSVLLKDKKPLLNVYKTNQEILSTVILDPSRVSSLVPENQSQHNMINNYNYFFDTFCSVIGVVKNSDGAYLDESFKVEFEKYHKLIEYYMDFINFRVCKIYSFHLSEAYEMFETINNRGIPLKPLDLLKNHIFSKCYINDLSLEDDDSDIESKWNTIVTKLDALTGGSLDKSDKYLRYFANATISFVRGDLLYEELIRSISNYEEAMYFVDNFTKALEFFRLAIDNDYATSEISASTKRIFIGFSDNSFDSYSPMALSVYLKNTGSDDLDSKLHAILSIYDKFYVLNVVPKISTTGKLEEPTSKLAIQYSKGLISLSKTIDEIDSYIECGEVAEDALLGLDWKKTPVTRYVLSEIYNRTSGSDYVDRSKVNVEHIMPTSCKNLKKNWPTITEEEHMRCCHKLGNLLLLNENINSKIKDRDFDYKKDWYLKNDVGNTCKKYADVQDSLIIDCAGWNEETIRERTEFLVNMIIELWPKPTFGDE